MYDGAHLNAASAITGVVSQDFDDRLILAGRGIQQIWREVAQIEGIEERRVVLCVDAINENQQAKELLRQLDELVEGPWPWLKVVFSSRPETWHAIKRGVKLTEALYYREAGAETVGVELEPFSYSEQMEPFSRQELPAAYTKYQQAFKLQTPYEALPHDLRETLRDPLNLWLVAKTYAGQVIPAQLKMTELIAQYVAALLQSERLREADLRLLEKQLAPMMVSQDHYRNAITIPELDAAGGGLYEAIYSEQLLSDGQRLNQSFVNLVDADILVRQTEGRDQKITFKYERFYEYFVGRHLFALSQTQVDRSAFFRELVGQIAEAPFLWGAVKYALIQEAKEHRPEIVLQLCFTDQQRVKEMIVSVLTDFGQENRVDVTPLLEKLVRARQKTSLGSFEENEANKTAKRIAMEVASRLGILSVLEIAADDSSHTIRVVATRQIYYLWNRNKEQGFSILRKIGGKARSRWGWPNARILETFFGVSFLIFFQNYEDKEITETLRLITREVIKQLFFVSGNTVGLVLPLIRAWVLKLTIRFATSFGKITRYNVVNATELGAFFELPDEEQQRLERFLPYLNRQRTDIEAIKDDLLAAVQTGDVLISYAIYHLLISQSIPNWQKVKPLVEEFFNIGMNNTIQDHIPHVIVPQMLNVPAGICMTQKMYDEDALDLYQELTKKFYNTSKGQSHGKYGVYFSTYLSTMAFLFGKNDDIEKSLWVQECLKAIKEQDEKYLLDLVWDLGNLALGFERPDLALRAARFLLLVDIASVNSAFINFLAQVKIRYPDQVDDFFAENEVSIQVIEKVKSIEAVEELSSILVVPITRFFASVPSSPTWSDHDIDIFKRALECNNVNQWLEFMAKKIINGVYGEPLFAIN
jgi:hypothetical protein